MTGRLAGFYDDFSRALVSADPAARPEGLSGTASHRFAIYRNNVHRGLCDALAAAYPTVAKLVGEAFFTGMATTYITAERQRPRSLALYGDGFAAFVDGHAAAISALPYLGDLARLERARLEALHAEDAPALSASHLAGMEQGLERLTLRPHPATRLVLSGHPIHAIWQAQNAHNTRSGEDRPAGSGKIVYQGEAVLVTRPVFQVQMRTISPGDVRFCQALFEQGAPLEEACPLALAHDPEFDVTRCFADLLLCGAFDARPITGISHELSID